MNLTYQSFQGLERRLSTGDLPETHIFEQIGHQEQRFQDLEDWVAGLHNQSMEVGDRLGDLETGRCRCRCQGYSLRLTGTRGLVGEG